MEKSIYKYIIGHTLKDQIKILLITVSLMPVIYYSLNIPKLITNKAIGGTGPFGVFGTGPFGVGAYSYDMTQVQYLLLLSLVFLAMVIINGGLKYIVNVYRGVLGERMLRRFRYTLYTRILRFPLPHFKNVSASEIIPMVTAETEPLGGFIGDSIALPVMQGGLLLTYLYFIFVQDFWLGIAAIALYPPQIYLIPRLQSKVNQLNKARVQKVRKLADRIGESVTNIADIHVNDTGHYERADISQRLGEIFLIRNEIYRRKFFIKFLNNFLGNLTPFFFYSIGGYLAINGELSVGALLAVLVAYKDIGPPWKELLKFYQITEDVKVKYAQIIEQFDPPEMLDEKLLEADQQPPQQLSGNLRVKRLSYLEESTTQIEHCDFELAGDQHIAILSKDGSSSNELMQLLARLLMPSSGSIHVGPTDLHVLPESVTGQSIGYCSVDSQVFNASLRDNLYYGLKHHPQPQDAESPEAILHKQTIGESIASGNSTQNVATEWIDIKLAGANNQEEFTQIVYAIIVGVELDEELLTLALRAPGELDIPAQLAAQIVTLRAQLITEINEIEAGTVIESLHPGKYIHNLTVAENLLFGTPTGQISAADFLATNKLFGQILRDSGLHQDLSVIGLELASLMVELFSDVDDDSQLFEQFSFIQSDDLPHYQQLLTTANSDVANLDEQQRAKLISVSLQLCPARHRLDLVTPALQKKVVAARKALMHELGAPNDHIQFFDKTKYHHRMSVQENLLFGKIVHAKGHLQPRITETIRSTLKSTHMDQAILFAGLNCPAGASGAKLSTNFRQKLTTARALLKNSPILIINNALSGLDSKSFSRIMDNIIRLRKGKNLIWALNNVALLERFEQIIILENNKLLHHGSFKSSTKVLETL